MFTQKTSDVMWELFFNNERSWFMEHRDEFEEQVNKPFRALAEETAALMSERFASLDLRLHISRIYRDARRLHGKGPYKDHLWFSLKSGETLLDGPMFWFEIGAADYSYGVGFFSATPQQMQAFRDSVDANPAAFERLAAGVERLGRYSVIGEEYKRPKGERGELINKWYNRRQVGVEHSGDFGPDVLEPELAKKLCAEFAALMPLYEFFMRFYRAAEKDGGADAK